MDSVHARSPSAQDHAKRLLAPLHELLLDATDATNNPTNQNQEDEELEQEHNVVLSSLSELVQHKTAALVDALRSQEDRSSQLEIDNARLQKLHGEAAGRVISLQNTVDTIKRGIEEIESRLKQEQENHKTSKQEHAQFATQASINMKAHQQHTEDQLVERENRVRQRIAEGVAVELEETQKLHETTVQTLQASHATMVAQHHDSLQLFAACKEKFKEDVKHLKELHEVKLNTLRIEHETDLNKTQKESEQRILQQHTTHHHAVNLQEQIHDTATMVHKTTLEAKVRAELLAVEQERDHYRLSSEILEVERDKWRDATTNVERERNAALQVKEQEHEEEMRAIEARHREASKGRLEEKDHLIVVGRLEQKIMSLEMDLKRGRSLLERERERHSVEESDVTRSYEERISEIRRSLQQAMEENDAKHCSEVTHTNERHRKIEISLRKEISQVCEDRRERDERADEIQKKMHSEQSRVRRETNTREEAHRSELFRTRQTLKITEQKASELEKEIFSYRNDIDRIKDDETKNREEREHEREEKDKLIESLQLEVDEAQTRLLERAVEEEEERRRTDQETARERVREARRQKDIMETLRSEHQTKDRKSDREHLMVLRRLQEESISSMLTLRSMAEKKMEWVAHECHDLMLVDVREGRSQRMVRGGRSGRNGRNGRNGGAGASDGRLHRTPSMESIESSLRKERRDRRREVGSNKSIPTTPTNATRSLVSSSSSPRSPMLSPPRLVREASTLPLSNMKNVTIGSISTLRNDSRSSSELIVLERTLRSMLTSHLETLSAKAKDVTKQVALLRHERALREEEEDEEEEQVRRRNRGRRAHGNGDGVPTPRTTRRKKMGITPTKKKKNQKKKKLKAKVQNEVIGGTDIYNDDGNVVARAHVKLNLRHTTAAAAAANNNMYKMEEDEEYVKEETQRVEREKGWNNTVGSPMRQPPPVFSANLDGEIDGEIDGEMDSDNKSVGNHVTTSQRRGTYFGTYTTEQASGKGDDPREVQSTQQNNQTEDEVPAWVPTQRRTSMFSRVRRPSIQQKQNQHGTVLAPAPANPVFNVR